MSQGTKKILTICGSLRAASSNRALLDAAALVAPPHVRVERYESIADLPAFNPDMEEDAASLPAPVAHWRAAVAAADALLISSPEYAHGIPGALKNALDWLVGSIAFPGKAVGMLNASAASRFAHPQLIEVLTVMSANVVAEASVLIDIPRRGASADQLAADPALASTLRAVLSSLVATVSISASSST